MKSCIVPRIISLHSSHIEENARNNGIYATVQYSSRHKLHANESAKLNANSSIVVLSRSFWLFYKYIDFVICSDIYAV